MVESGPGTSQENLLNLQTEDDLNEPKAKKLKTGAQSEDSEYKLEDRLCGILCCTVCLDLPKNAVYQCVNGHLMCNGCFAHLLADARLKDEASTCPNCRCDISKTSCTRNLAAEKAVCELPSECQFCLQQLPRSQIEHHEREKCFERLTDCKFNRIGCPWNGPYHELQQHEDECCHPHKDGADIMTALQKIDQQNHQQMSLYKDVFNLLSYEKVTFNDLQLRPYRTDDFITKLFYETSRFSAFSYQWVIKARVNDDHKSPNLLSNRYLSYQLVLKSRITNPIEVYFVALKGPYGEAEISPSIYKHEFYNDAIETDYKMLPFSDNTACNKVLAAKTINVRLILFQVQK